MEREVPIEQRPLADPMAAGPAYDISPPDDTQAFIKRLIMKKTLPLLLFSVLLSLKSVAAVPEGAIPFIFDRHLYLQSTLNDSIPVTVVYDTGADFLYLAKDFLKLNDLHDAFGRRGKAKMGGAGNG